IGYRFTFELIEDFNDFHHGISAPAVCVHVDHKQIRPSIHCLFHTAAHEINQRRHDVLANRQDIDLPPSSGGGLAGAQIEASPGNHCQQKQSDKPDIHDERLSHLV